jgi:hypothetical protein
VPPPLAGRGHEKRRTPSRDDRTPDQNPHQSVLLDGLIDALGVIVGVTRRHLPAQQDVAPANGRGAAGEPRTQSLCGLTTGRVVARDSVDNELPMCVTCMNVASNLILTTEQIGGRIRTRRTRHDRSDRLDATDGWHGHRNRPVSA